MGYRKVCGLSCTPFLRERLPLPSRLSPCHLPQGDGFSGSGKLCGIAKRRPREGRLPPRRGKMSRSDKKGNLSPQVTEGVMNNNKKRLCRSRAVKVHTEINQRLENWGARRAAFRPYFLRSFIRGSRVRKPAFFSTGRFSSLCCSRARLRP